MDPLIGYQWPGNIRELENVVERALIRYQGGLLFLDDFLSLQDRAKNDNGQTSAEVLPFDQVVKKHILLALKHRNGQISGDKGAASLLEMHPNTLRTKMQKLGIPIRKNRLKAGADH